MNSQTGFPDVDPAQDGFQYLEDLATAYWYSEVLFSALELHIFLHLEQGGCSLPVLAEKSCCKEAELNRLLRSLARIGLVSCFEDNWMNSLSVSRYLIPGKIDYMGDFFLYRKYMQSNWNGLTKRLLVDEPAEKADLSYEERNRRYVGAMDTLMRQKAQEIADCLKDKDISGPVLDVGGGAGGIIRTFRKVMPDLSGLVFDLPEVIDAALSLYPEPSQWHGITMIKGDFRSQKLNGKFGLVILSNFLHAYGEAEARELLEKAAALLDAEGVLLIHDYFPDRGGTRPHKGALYDLCMMLNTYNGSCHEYGDIRRWLQDIGLTKMSIRDLTTDTSFILAGGGAELHAKQDPWLEMALAEGFDKAKIIDPREVVTGAWVGKKCRFGCDRFGTNLQCPPHGMDYLETRTMLDDYNCAVLVQGQPPGNDFHQKLLRLEKGVFLAGNQKAFVFVAGPCTICPECPESGKCRHHNLARPSMEGSGIDVYSTAGNAGWSLAPVKKKGGYVQYIGLLLVS